MSSLMGVDLENFILRVRSLNLRPFEHWGVAEKKKLVSFSASTANLVKGTGE